MKSLTIPLLALAGFSLYAESQPPAATPDWKLTALRAQALMKQSKFAEAAELGQRALVMAKRSGAPGDKVAATYHLLGMIYRNWGRCAESRANYTHAIAMWHKEAHPNPRYISASEVNYISTLCECDDFAAAQKAYHTYEKELRQNRIDTMDDAKVLSLQAVLARIRKDYVRSEALFRKTIDLMEHTPNAKPVDIAAERGNLSVVLDKEGRQDEALEQSQQVIEVLEKESPHHPSLVAAYNNAACALDDLGRKDEAVRMFQRALAAAGELYGEDNHITAKIMLSYASVLRHNNQSPEAEVWQKKGTEAFHRALVHDNAMVDIGELRR
ncbi:MAG TPA: tetratricopeptide repeat protein [Bryobacteraceae bacterium]